ncbi:NADPH:quinone reductase [Faunimonas pinastri]|uniref:NADPH:quinone reductase n=1 Tax=Faunimonas pinastri TaxID=1855383 RepID=A0A1H9NT67_9HYPH|nr:NADP-dependent oxidoreductase [Faunimonas pinastri]SER39091.1 NADPH:quinone reductase [Faunimonas pinastri]
MASMKAVRIHFFGGPEVLRVEDVPVPEPKAGEILLRVQAASVNPVDYKIRSGKYPLLKAEDLPVTMGRDVAGTVERLGEGVSGFRVGEALYAMLGRDRGGYAQYVILKPEEAAAKPETLNATEAGAVPLAALTAWQGLFDHGGLKQGQRVLIHGAGGGVGHLAVQFARAKGAWVAATASSQDVKFVKELGADQVIDHKAQKFEDAVEPVDLVYDLISGETEDRSWAVLKEGGILVSTLHEPDKDKAAAYKARGARYMAQPDAGQLAEIAKLIDGGLVRVQVQKVFPLAQAAEAQRVAEEEHTQGKIVLDTA